MYTQLSIYKNTDGSITSNGIIDDGSIKYFIQKVWYSNVNFKIVALFKFKN